MAGPAEGRVPASHVFRRIEEDARLSGCGFFTAKSSEPQLKSVIAGLVPAIHVVQREERKRV